MGGLVLNENRSVDPSSTEMWWTSSMPSSNGFYFSMKHEMGPSVNSG